MFSWEVWILVIVSARVSLSHEDYYVLETKNIALNKPTTQSSTLQGPSSQAVNGNYDDFSATESGDFSWWTVDLGTYESITMIKAYNRKDCCQERLANVSIWTSDQPEPGIPDAGNDRWTKRFSRRNFAKTLIVKVFNNRIEARYVAVTTEFTNEPLNLAEVEIYGWTATTNVALGKPARQSGTTTPEENLASTVNNGMIEDCSKIDNNGNWWQVDLKRLYSLNYVRVHKGFGCEARGPTNVIILFNDHHSANPPSSAWKRNTYQSQERLEQVFAFVTYYQHARHVRVKSRSGTLALAEVEVFVYGSLAYERPTRQSSTFGSYGSHLAVNGYHKDFTHTQLEGMKWWTVDLLEVFFIGSIDIINRLEYWERLAKLSIFMSKMQGHRILARYEENTFQGQRTFYVSDGREVRHIYLQSNNSNAYFSLAEVLVAETTCVGVLSTSQSSTKDNNYELYGAQHAADWRFTNKAITNEYIDEEQWWMMKWTKAVVMTSFAVYFDQGQCQSLQGNSVDCTKVSGNIQIKTSIEESPPNVTLATNEGWSLCYRQELEPLAHQIHAACNRNERHRLAKHFSIQPTVVGQHLNLREVTIFGKKLPEFNRFAVVTAQQQTLYSFQLVIPQWKGTDVGGVHPTSYKVKLSEIAEPQIFHHDSNVENITSTWSHLRPNVEYSYSVTCQFRGIDCPGRVLQGSVSTLMCSQDPSKPEFEWSFSDDGGQKRLKVTSIVARPACQTFTNYEVVLANQFNEHYRESSPTPEDRDIERVPSDINHTLTVTVTNSHGRENSGTKQVLATADVPDQPTQFSLKFNSSCMRLQVGIRTNHVFHELLFQISCSSDNQSKLESVNATETRRADVVFCGFPSNTFISCDVTAENGIGTSSSLNVMGSTSNISIPLEVTSGSPTTSSASTVRRSGALSLGVAVWPIIHFIFKCLH